MPSFGTVALPDINPLFDLASVDRNVNAINGGRLTNQLASNTLDSNTKIAANAAEGGTLANQYASQRNPLEISLLRQQTGAESSPVFDKLQNLYNGGGAAPAGDGPAPQGQSLLNGPMPVSADPQTQQDIGAEAKAQGVNPDWAMRVHSAESGASKEPFGPGSTSSAGAIGPMQLMPDTAKGLGVDPNSYSGNIKGGVTYLGQMKARYVSPVLATAAYNAGPGKVDDFLAGKSGLPPETIAYVGKVFGTDGASILNAAMSGAHGHVIPGVAAPAAQTSAAAPPAQPGVTLAPDGAPAPAPVQTATRGPMPGDTANDGTAAPTPGFGPDGQPLAPGTWDASPVAAAPQAAPVGQGVSDVMARLRNAPQVQNPNSLLDVAAPDGSAPPAPQNALAPPAPASAQPGTGMNSPQVQQAQALVQRAAQIEMAAAQTPNDPRAKATAAAMAADLRGRAAVLMQADSVTVDPLTKVQTHMLTGKQDAPAMGRITHVDDGRNVQVLDGAGNVINTIPKGGYDLQKSDYERDAKELSGISDAGAQAQSNQIRLTQMQQLASRISTGAGGGKRADWANLAETVGMPEIAKKLISSNGGDAAAAQEFAKMSLQSAGSQERGVLGSRGGYQAIKLFQSANPSLELRPDANRKIINMQLIGAQADADYAKGALAYANDQGDRFRSGEGKYTPLSHFDQQWQEQRNPQIYAAAMGALNGDSFDKWTKALNTKSPADVQAALGIIRRAAPGATVVWADGTPHSVGQ